MKRKKQMWRKKHGKVVDMYDGKIIRDKEAISKRNIDIVIEKEGAKDEKD